MNQRYIYVNVVLWLILMTQFRWVFVPKRLDGQQTTHQIYQELMIVNYCLVLIKIKHFFLDFELFPWTFQQNIDIVFANEHRVLLKNPLL